MQHWVVVLCIIVSGVDFSNTTGSSILLSSEYFSLIKWRDYVTLVIVYSRPRVDYLSRLVEQFG